MGVGWGGGGAMVRPMGVEAKGRARQQPKEPSTRCLAGLHALQPRGDLTDLRPHRPDTLVEFLGSIRRLLQFADPVVKAGHLLVLVAQLLSQLLVLVLKMALWMSKGRRESG